MNLLRLPDVYASRGVQGRGWVRPAASGAISVGFQAAGWEGWQGREGGALQFADTNGIGRERHLLANSLHGAVDMKPLTSRRLADILGLFLQKGQYRRERGATLRSLKVTALRVSGSPGLSLRKALLVV